MTYPFYVVLFKRTSRTETLNTLYITLYVFGNVDVKLFMLLFCMLLEDDI